MAGPPPAPAQAPNAINLPPQTLAAPKAAKRLPPTAGDVDLSGMQPQPLSAPLDLGLNARRRPDPIGAPAANVDTSQIRSPGPKGQATAGAEGVDNPFGGSEGRGAGGGPAKSSRQLAMESLGMAGPEYEQADYETRQATQDLQTEQQKGAIRAQLAGQQLADMQAAQAQRAADYAVRMQGEQKEREGREAKAFGEIDSITTDLATSRVDPDHIWKEKGTGAQIVAALGVAMGAFGAALAHTPNYAMEIVQRQIDRDIDAQKENIATKGRVLGAKQGAFQMLRQRGLDHAASEAGAYAVSWDAVTQKMEALKLQAVNEDQKSRADQALKFAQLKSAEAKQNAMQAIRAQQYKIDHPPATGAGAATALAETEEKLQPSESALGRVEGNMQGDDVPGYGAGGRVAAWLSDKTGLNLQSSEAKDVRSHVIDLYLQKLVNEHSARANVQTATEEAAKYIRTPEDVRNLLAEVKAGNARRREIAVAKGSKKAPSAPRQAEQVDEEEP